MSFLLVSASLLADNSTSNGSSATADVQPINASVYITNNAPQQLKVEWQLALSSNIQTDVMSQLVDTKAQLMKASEGIDWFVEHAQQAPNAFVYTLTVCTYDVGGTKFSEEQVLITRSFANLTADKAKNDLLITVNSNYTIDYALR